jgi:hypothetical protein
MRNVLPIFILLLLCSHIYSAEYKGGESVEIQSGDTLISNLFVGAQSIELQGYVGGSYFCGSQKNNISGEVSGNVVSGCQDLSIRGKVHGMVICFSENLLIDGEIGDDVIFFGSVLRMTSRAHIKGNLYAGAGKLSLEMPELLNLARILMPLKGQKLRFQNKLMNRKLKTFPPMLISL